MIVVDTYFVKQNDELIRVLIIYLIRHLILFSEFNYASSSFLNF